MALAHTFTGGNICFQVGNQSRVQSLPPDSNFLETVIQFMKKKWENLWNLQRHVRSRVWTLIGLVWVSLWGPESQHWYWLMAWLLEKQKINLLFPSARSKYNLSQKSTGNKTRVEWNATYLLWWSAISSSTHAQEVLFSLLFLSFDYEP